MPENKVANDRAYYQRNRARVLARVKRRADARRGELRAYSRAYYRQHRATWPKPQPEVHRAAVARYQRRHLADHVTKQQRRRAWKAGSGGTHTTAEWMAKLAAFGHRCAYCGRGDVELTRDHVKPLRRGGTNSMDNIVPACRPCNSRKGAREEVLSFQT
jgi:5-methylcytosine-specific restriction endonuclease McrA